MAAIKSQFSPILDHLIRTLQYLPGVGPRSAERIAFQLLSKGQARGLELSKALATALTTIRYCCRCHNFSETELCPLCSNDKRDSGLLCVVESPLDVLAIERTASFSGFYYVLQGHLSPLDGIGPKELHLDQLQQRMQEPTLNEVILATNPTIEGEATADYISRMAAAIKLKVTRLAHGIPLGGELEYLDGNTISRALLKRELVSNEPTT